MGSFEAWERKTSWNGAKAFCVIIATKVGRSAVVKVEKVEGNPAK